MKTAIVTGAGAGIGKAICQNLKNYRVGMLDLNEENVNEASKGIENSFPLRGIFTNQSPLKPLRNLVKFLMYLVNQCWNCIVWSRGTFS